MSKKPNFSIYITEILTLYLATAMIVSPTLAVSGAYNALKICADTVIPSLFPFIFCGNMFVALGGARCLSRYFSIIMHPLFGVSGSGALAFILGIVSGYPVGASCAASLYSSGECTKDEAETLLAFCNNSGPMFIIGVVGVEMLNSHRLGVFLYLIHVFSAILSGIIVGIGNKTKSVKLLPPSRDTSDIKTAVPDMGAAIGNSIDTILKICGFIIIFAVFTAVIPNNPIKKYIYCLLEITGGIKMLTIDFSTNLLPYISFFLALSGISVLAQVMAIITPCGLSIKKYVVGKLIQSAIAFLLTFASIKISPAPIPTFAETGDIIFPSAVNIWGISAEILAITYIITLTILFILFCKRRYFK